MQKGGHGIVSELKSVGIERDKQIAEERGECYYYADCCSDGCPWNEGKITECAYPDITIGEHDTLPPRSTDISCAMELWEEMKGAGFCHMGQYEMSDKIYNGRTMSNLWFNYIVPALGILSMIYLRRRMRDE
jgi:hypothetical protein